MTPPEPRHILAPNPGPMTLDGTRTFLVGREAPVVIDPGPDEPAHVEAVLAALNGKRPVSIVVTHRHPDHAGAAPELTERTGAPMRALPESPSRVGLDAFLPIADGGRIDTDAGPLEIVATPGHSRDHAVVWWPAARAAFVGDLMMGVGDTTLVAEPEGDLAAYLASLDRLESLRPETLYPAHGPPLSDASAAIARYRAHREERLDQVRQALAQAPRARVDELVGIVYGKSLPEGLRRAAEGSMRAMLEYLRATG